MKIVPKHKPEIEGDPPPECSCGGRLYRSDLKQVKIREGVFEYEDHYKERAFWRCSVCDISVTEIRKPEPLVRQLLATLGSIEREIKVRYWLGALMCMKSLERRLQQVRKDDQNPISFVESGKLLKKLV